MLKKNQQRRKQKLPEKYNVMSFEAFLLNILEPENKGFLDSLAKQIICFISATWLMEENYFNKVSDGFKIQIMDSILNYIKPKTYATIENLSDIVAGIVKQFTNPETHNTLFEHFFLRPSLTPGCSELHYITTALDKNLIALNALEQTTSDTKTLLAGPLQLQCSLPKITQARIDFLLGHMDIEYITDPLGNNSIKFLNSIKDIEKPTYTLHKSIFLFALCLIMNLLIKFTIEGMLDISFASCAVASLVLSQCILSYERNWKKDIHDTNLLEQRLIIVKILESLKKTNLKLNNKNSTPKLSNKNCSKDIDTVSEDDNLKLTHHQIENNPRIIPQSVNSSYGNRKAGSLPHNNNKEIQRKQIKTSKQLEDKLNQRIAEIRPPKPKTPWDHLNTSTVKVVPLLSFRDVSYNGVYFILFDKSKIRKEISDKKLFKKILFFGGFDESGKLVPPHCNEGYTQTRFAEQDKGEVKLKVLGKGGKVRLFFGDETDETKVVDSKKRYLYQFKSIDMKHRK